jgi:hypothetical protein
MPLLLPHALTIAEVAQRWDTSPARVAQWAVGGALTLSIIVPAIEVAGEGQLVSNLAEALAGELWPLFRSSHPLDAVLVRRVRSPGMTEWRRIVEPRDGLLVTVADVHVTPGECERFERGQGVTGSATGANARHRGGRPPAHDWEALYGWAARRVHDQGLPASQAELVREALDWLGAKGDDALPDESTVRRKLAGFWRALVSPPAA